MKRVTKAEALRALKNAVTRRGADHYIDRTNAKYFHYNGKPSCIVGEAMFHEWGLKKKDLGGLNGSGFYDITPFLKDAGVLEFTEAAERLLGNAQDFQDGEMPWGEAVKKAVAVS